MDSGLPFNLYVINVDQATIAPVNQFIAPFDVLAIALNGHVASTKAQKVNAATAKERRLNRSKLISQAVTVTTKTKLASS